MSLAQSPKREVIHNPLGTRGFEFVEFHSISPEPLVELFTALGFKAVAKHSSIPITLYQQGRINFVLNESAVGFSAEFSKLHGPCACSMAFRMKDAEYAYQQIIKSNPELKHDFYNSLDGFQMPVIKGIGGSKLYLTDEKNNQSQFFDRAIGSAKAVTRGAGLTYIDHLTHNVHQGEMDRWAEFYQKTFNFQQIRYFDIKGDRTGLVSRAMASPCGHIKIPINESQDDQSQIEEYLQRYNGEGIQHIALGTRDIYKSIEILRDHGLTFLEVPDAYYDSLEKRLPNHGEDIARLQKLKILVDGDTQSGQPKLLLQLFTDTVIGPIFFEIIQRKGDKGFGEGNFQALFDAIELDQIRRGVLKK
ncbi:MAG: 4-hydroxyphenylpyruvate dioxygenase [Moraxellaceae bacterium]|nr:MAG: 4-hydroxyphenylpyruvate dioxygenase [Moraxellaceae bacterium]